MSAVISDLSVGDGVQRLQELPKCVLLAGSARGGTSWALKVLDSHPAVCGCHEPFYRSSSDPALQQVLDRLKAGQRRGDDVQQLILKAIEARVQTHKPPFFPKPFLAAPAWLQTVAWAGARLFRPLEPAFRSLATGRLDQRHRLVIKNRPYPRLERISEAISADNLLLLRHPCGVVSSWLQGIRMGVMTADSADPAASWDRYSELLEPLGFTSQQLLGMSPAGILAVNWLVDTVLFRRFENEKTKTRTFVYEELVRSPVQQWSQVFDWMGLSMCDSVEAFLTGSSRSRLDLRHMLGKRYSYFSVRRSDNSPVNAWRKSLSLQEIDEILRIVTPHFPVDHYWPDVRFPGSSPLAVHTADTLIC